MPAPHRRKPVAADAPKESVSMHVEFEWHLLGNITLLSDRPPRFELPEVRYPGVYRLTASVAGGTVADGIWYVGQSMVSIDGRVLAHIGEKSDGRAAHDKKFLARLRQPNGWCQLEEARSIQIDGHSELVGLKDGCFDAATIASDSKCHPAVQYLMNVIESTGQADSTTFANSQGKR